MMALPLRVCRKCGLEALTTEDLEFFEKTGEPPCGRSNLCKQCLNKHQNKKRRTDDQIYLKTKYTSMVGRCYNPSHTRFSYYGGRGITVCNEWLNNSNVFVDWALNNGWKRGLTIERINNEGSYSPDNCRWTTMKEQGKNRRNTVIFLENGTQFCSRCGIEKPLTEFHTDNTAPRYRKYACKKCINTQARRKYQDNTRKES